MLNLRRYARLKTVVDVVYRIEGTKSARLARTKSHNIGIGGICFESSDKCKIGMQMELEIFLEPDNPVKVEGSIIWQKRFDDGSQRIGVKFENLKEEDLERFNNFIFQKMYEMTGVGHRSGLVKYAKEHGWEEIKE